VDVLFRAQSANSDIVDDYAVEENRKSAAEAGC
jgi:hypothetical protein